MATASQIKALIKSHYEENDERFNTLVLQLAAHEARKGHSALAHDIRSLVDESKKSRVKVLPINRDLQDLVLVTKPSYRLSQLVVPGEIRERIEKILKEFWQKEKLLKHGLSNRRKILLTGPPGTGKTMTASVIAGETGLPFNIVLVDKLVTKYMGETSAKLRQIFDLIQASQGLYLFDEFDAIGAERSRENDVGEMRRILNAFLQFLEQDDSDSFVVAATNNVQLLDYALFRRFDDVLHYELPDSEMVKKLIENRLGNFMGSDIDLDAFSTTISGLSHAEITQACDDAIKEAILGDQETVDGKTLSEAIEHKMKAYNNKKGTE